MGITQKAIARKLNISQAHVARALGGRSAVSADTRRRIEAAAREMGYDRHTNREARAMAGRRYSQRLKTNVVAVALTVVEGVVPRHLPFYSAFLEGVESEAAVAEYDVCIIHKNYNYVPRLLRSSELDGAIIAGFTMDQIPLIRSSGLAVVTYGAACAGVPSVGPDDHAGIYKATRHLLELGHREIAYAGVLSHGDSVKVVAARLQGYKDALIEFGVPVRDEWIMTNLMIPGTSKEAYCQGCDICAACVGWKVLRARAGMVRKDNPPFTAVVCHNDSIAMGIIRHAQADGLSVPHDLSVTGFDNLSSLYNFQPGITSAGCSHYEMGRSAMRLLRSAIEEGSEAAEANASFGQHHVFSVNLFTGESTAAPATKAETHYRSTAYA